MFETICLAGMMFANLWGSGNLQVPNNTEKDVLDGWSTPIPVQPWVADRITECPMPADHRVPILPPIPRGHTPMCESPPDHAEILRAMPPLPRGVPYIYEEFRDDVEFIVEKLVDKVDPPRFFPLIGPAQLHHCHWKCTVYFTETTESAYPFPFRIQRKRVEVVYIDKDHLHLCVENVQEGAEQSDAKPSCPAGGCAKARPQRAKAPDILLIEAVRLVPKAPYRLEPLEVLAIDTRDFWLGHVINGRFAISTEGMIDFGQTLGAVRVAGLTLNEAQEAIRAHLNRERKLPIAIHVTLEQSRAARQITGDHLIRPDGTISLGIYGSVSVDGLTLGQIKAVVEKHLGQYLSEVQISVDVKAYNSRKITIIGHTEPSEPAASVPVKKARHDAPMNISDVVRMAKKGIAQDIIVRQMELTNSTFNLTVDDIIELHDQGVNEAIIRAMQERREGNTSSGLSPRAIWVEMNAVRP